MSVNILDVFRNQIEGKLISSASSFLGEGESATKNALDAISSTLLGAMIQKSSTNTGANELLDLLKSDDVNSAALIENISSEPSDGYNLNNIMNKGLPIVRTLLGGTGTSVIDWISAKFNIKSSSTASLMSLVAPFLAGIVGKEAAKSGFSAAGLSTLLAQQAPFVKSLLPAGLAGITNFNAISNPSSRNEPLSGAPLKTESSTSPDARNTDTSFLGGFIPWLILILGLGLLWYFMRGCNNPKVEETVTNTSMAVDTIKENAANAIDSVKADANVAYVALKGKVDEFGNWISDLGKDYEVKLPNGKVLKVYESSIERNLVDFINSGEKDEEVLKNKWFSFDRLYFKSGKSELTNESKGQLDNIGMILAAYPNVNIKMGGYTDSDGEESFNQKLSQERAEIAKKELLKRGIGAGRVESEGYGEQYPRCPANDTKECKSQNRRIDIRVTKM